MLTAKPNSPRQNQNAHGETIKLTAKAKTRGKSKNSRQNKKLTAKQKTHDKTKKLTAKPKTHGKTKKLTAKQKSSRQNQIVHGKTKKLAAKPNSSRQKKKAHGKTRKGRSWTLTVLAMVVEEKQDMVALFSILRCFALFKLRNGGCLRSEVLCETWSR